MEQIQLINPSFFDALRAFIKAEIKQLFQEEKAELQNYQDEYLTIDEVCNYIKVTRSTLWDWSKRGVLCKHYIAGQPRYRKSEVDAAFLKLDETGGRNG